MKGVVVCPQPRAADVGAAMLADGGNAFDALVGTAFAQAVVDPFMGGPGGFGSMQYFSSGDHGTIDFHTRAGSKVTEDMWEADYRGRTEVSAYTVFDDFRSELGYTSIMVPGMVAGMWDAHRRFGRLPWREVLAPAIELARRGVGVAPFVHQFFTRVNQPGIPSGHRRLTTTAECARIFLQEDGSVYEVNQVHRNPDMANMLETLARDGGDSFYTGEIAEVIASDLEANGSYITRGDLAFYRVRHNPPVVGRYRGLKVASVQPPGSGPTVIEMLQILDHFDLTGAGHNTPDYIDLLARAMSAAHVDRQAALADPEFYPVPVDWMVSEDRADEWASRIEQGEFPDGARDKPYLGTTVVCVYDEEGNAVTCTHSLGSGSGVVTPGLGFVYNNSMKLFDPIPGRPNSIAPGKARPTGLVPTIVFENGRPFLIAGAPGGSMVISMVLQSLLNSIDHGMHPVQAVTEPRIHCEGEAIHLEAQIEQSVTRRLEEMGHRVRHQPFGPLNFSRAHLIRIEADGSFDAAADPRGGAGRAFSRT
jgi:gamma-glutamyltranspeptidase / glutathione hydrolase